MSETFGIEQPFSKTLAYQAQVFFYAGLIVLTGPVTVLAAWVISRRQIPWKHQVGAAVFGVLWTSFLFGQLPLWEVSLFTKFTIWWGALLLASPGLAVALKGWRVVVSFLRSKDLSDHLDEQQRLLAEKQAALSRTAAQTANQETASAPGYLTLGAYMQGERFPEYLGVRREGAWLQLSNPMLAQHLLIIGTTGAGKSETIKRLIAETLRETERDIFFIDGKGDLPFGQTIAQMIYEARAVTVPLFLMGLSETGSLYHGFRGAASDIYNRLCALVGVEEAVGNATYFADVNRELLQLICLAPEGPPRSFEELIDRLDLTWLSKTHAQDPRNRAAVKALDKESLSGLRMRLSPLSRELAPLIHPDGFVLEESRGAVFTLRTQSVGDTARRFLRFFVEDVKDFVGKRQQRPGLLIIDEFGAFNNENILALLTLARSADLGVVLATQDIASLGEEQTRRLIMANTRTKILMATDFPEEVAQLAGTMYGIEASIQHQDGEATGSGSARVQHQFRVDMNEVARLQPGEAFLIRQRYAAKFKVKPVGKITGTPDAIASFVRSKPLPPTLDESDFELPPIQ
jgi:hypothetical protein